MLTCKEFLDGISDFIDNDVSPEIKQKLEKHINECPNCWVVYDTTQKTIQVYKGMEEQKIPEDVHKRLLEAIEKRIAGKKSET